MFACFFVVDDPCASLHFALQAYTSQFVALIMFALLMCDDRISMQPRRREIIQGLRVLPGKYGHENSDIHRQTAYAQSRSRGYFIISKVKLNDDAGSEWEWRSDCYPPPLF